MEEGIPTAKATTAATPTEAGQAGEVGVAATVEEVAVVDLVEATGAGAVAIGKQYHAARHLLELPFLNGREDAYCRASQPAICPSGSRTTSESLN